MSKMLKRLPTVHMLKERVGRHVRMRCGLAVAAQTNGRWSTLWSVWGVDVTCPECCR